MNAEQVILCVPWRRKTRQSRLASVTSMCRCLNMHTVHRLGAERRVLISWHVCVRVVQDKAYETGIPQKLGDHANTARDAAASKYDDLTTQVGSRLKCTSLLLTKFQPSL